MEHKFGERVRELRLEKSMRQKELAEAVGVLERTVSYWECGRQECDFDMLIRLAKFFDVTTDYLLGYSEI